MRIYVTATGREGRCGVVKINIPGSTPTVASAVACCLFCSSPLPLGTAWLLGAGELAPLVLLGVMTRASMFGRPTSTAEGGLVERTGAADVGDFAL